MLDDGVYFAPALYEAGFVSAEHGTGRDSNTPGRPPAPPSPHCKQPESVASAKQTEYNGHPAVALQSSDGARATVLLHGGHLVSWIPAGGQEQLYVSPTSQYGEGQAVRGGVPVIFPQFSSRGTLPRHGLLRTRGWQLADTTSHGAARPGGAALRGRRRHARAVAARVRGRDHRQHHRPAARHRVRRDQHRRHRRSTSRSPCTAYLRTNDVLKAQLEGLQGVKYEDNTTGQWQQQWGDVTQVVGEVDRLYHDAPNRPLTLRELGRKLADHARRFHRRRRLEPRPAEGRAAQRPARRRLGQDDLRRSRACDRPRHAPARRRMAGMQTFIAG